MQFGHGKVSRRAERGRFLGAYESKWIGKWKAAQEKDSKYTLF